ncbi:dimethylaniline monooxygenase [N-oxide-forming] 2-like [Hyperolius riggenbachi]|uniref:dimethylaniline monooxygenase [N-oxide-forming] 2-like n=1 Tax=Hyperolius riggenbachi TaxID=752182 RepID=UPI0035A37ACC
MKVAVIGAGSSGLISIKCCLDEGLEPMCFEKSDDIGGLWKYKPEVEEGRASIYESVVTNTSKEMMCYSDFPFPDKYPNYLHNTKMVEYYRQFAKKFDVLKYIQFKTLVCSVKKHPSFPSTGQWEVTIEKDGTKETFTFDAVMVCSGHHTDPYYPLESFPGINTFKGQYLHSREYKTSKGFEEKRVLVIGMGNSGSDIAVELSRTASQVYLSTRRGSWIISRIYDDGYPWDICYDTRFQNLVRNSLPTPIVIWMTEKKMNGWFNHAQYGIQPRDSTQFKEPLFNDELPSRIVCGYVVIKPDVTKFYENAVEFDDGTIEENIDVVVFATGYRFSFPFLDESIPKIESKINLYRSIFPPDLEKPTLGVIGLIQPLGPIMAVSEMQARWVTRVFKGLCKLPPHAELKKDIEKKHQILLTRFGKENSLQLDYIEYLDELAIDIGCKPSALGLFVTDPVLAVKIFFGPCTPAQYRLTGPGQWPMARKQIMTTFERIVKPTKTRVVPDRGQKSLSFIIRLGALCVLVLFLAMSVYRK